MDNNGNTFLGLLTGTVIGAAFGILFAPDRGSVTRRKIADQAEATHDSITQTTIDLGDKAATSVASKKESLDKQIENIVSNVSHKTEDVITTLENKLAELKQKNKKLQKS